MRLLAESRGSVYVASNDFVTVLKGSGLQQFDFELGKGSQIVCVTVSSDGQYIFAGYANKYICCWNEKGDVVGSFMHAKRPTGLVSAVALDKKQVLVISDKAGFIYGTEVPTFQKQVIVAGHTASVITDMAADISGSYIATADRDEKVRISKFPHMETIQSFCLAHTNVVTSVAFVACDGGNISGSGTGSGSGSGCGGVSSLMLSTGWDHRLCLWSHTEGRLLDTVQYEADTSSGCSSSSSSSSSSAGVGAGVDANVSEEVDEVEGAEGVGEEDIAAVNEADLTEKTYDEDSAGHFPIKVAAALLSSSSGSSGSGIGSGGSGSCSESSRGNTGVVAVIFKNKPVLAVFPLRTETDVSTPRLLNREQGVEYELAAAPCDICFVAEHIVVLLPRPHYLQILTVTPTAAGSLQVDVATGETALTAVKRFQELCVDKAIDFDQQLVSGEGGGDAERGIRKHALDRPFTRNTGIDPDKKKGAKRSRRRGPEEE